MSIAAIHDAPTARGERPVLALGALFPAGRFTFEQVVAGWHAAREAELDSIWLAECPPVDVRVPDRIPFDVWTALGALAGLGSPRPRVGALLTADTFDPPLPRILKAMTANAVLEGRLVVGLGDAWSVLDRMVPSFAREVEHPTKRLEEEALALREHGGAARTREPSSEHFGLVAEPGIRLVVGGQSELLDAVAARFADAWLGSGTLGVLSRRVARLRRRCRAEGRGDVEVLAAVPAFVTEPAARARALRRAIARALATTEPEVRRSFLVGTRSEIRSTIATYAALGVSHLIFEPLDPSEFGFAPGSSLREQVMAVAVAAGVAPRRARRAAGALGCVDSC